MFPIAGPMAGLNGLNFLETLMGGRGVLKAKKNSFFFPNFIFSNFFSSNFFFHGQRRALPLVYNIL